MLNGNVRLIVSYIPTGRALNCPYFGYFVSLPTAVRPFSRSAVHSVAGLHSGSCWLIDYVQLTIRLCECAAAKDEDDRMWTHWMTDAWDTHPPYRALYYCGCWFKCGRSFDWMCYSVAAQNKTRRNSANCSGHRKRNNGAELLCLTSSTVGHLKLIIASFFVFVVVVVVVVFIGHKSTIISHNACACIECNEETKAARTAFLFFVNLFFLSFFLSFSPLSRSVCCM